MNVNGPRNFNPNMKADLAKQAKELAKLDESKAVGEAQQATAADRPEGDTDVNKTVIVTFGGDGPNSSYYYDGIDNGVVVYLHPDGSLYEMKINEDLHNGIRDDFCKSDE